MATRTLLALTLAAGCGRAAMPKPAGPPDLTTLLPHPPSPIAESAAPTAQSVRTSDGTWHTVDHLRAGRAELDRLVDYSS